MAEYELCSGRLTVVGKLDGDEEEPLRENLGKLLLDGANPLSLDLAAVDYIASSCVGSVVTFWIDLCAAGKKLELEGSPAVHKILDMSGLSVLFEGESC